MPPANRNIPAGPGSGASKGALRINIIPSTNWPKRRTGERTAFTEGMWVRCIRMARRRGSTALGRASLQTWQIGYE